MAIAGPAASLVIGFGCLALAASLGWRGLTEPHTGVTAVLVWLGYINVLLGIFNMIPGFPLDGGRVFRAIIWTITKNVERSTYIAARTGEVVAFIFIFYGIWSFFSGAGFIGLWIAFIGWFLQPASSGGEWQLQGTVTRSHLMQLLQAHSELQLSGAHHHPLHRMNQKVLTPQGSATRCMAQKRSTF